MCQQRGGIRERISAREAFRTMLRCAHVSSWPRHGSLNNSDDRSTKFIPGRALLVFCRSDGTSSEQTRNARAFRDRSAPAVNIAQALHSWSSSTCEGQDLRQPIRLLLRERATNEQRERAATIFFCSDISARQLEGDSEHERKA